MDYDVHRISLEVTRMDRIRHEHIKRTAQLVHFGNKIRDAKLKLFGDVQRRDSEYTE